MREVNQNDIEKELTNLINNRIEDCIYVVHKNPLVFKSKYGELNEEYCSEKNINICNSFNMGGIIVANVDDIDVGITKEEGWRVGKELLEFLKTSLEKLIPNKISIDNNDLIIDDKYKVISYASINSNNRLIYTCVHISFNPDIELINNVCLKKMIKIPRGLSDFGITREEVIYFLEEMF